MKKLIENVSQLNVIPQSFEKFSKPQNVLMVDPCYFDVTYAINDHMTNEAGTLNKIDKNKATEQWENLKEIYKKLDFNVVVCPAQRDLPDMVFCANQCFPFYTKNYEKHAILSNMHHPQRNLEVGFIHDFLVSQNYQTHRIASRTEKYFFESMGDMLWLNDHRFLLGGYGFRTEKRIYDKISEYLDVPIALFELKNPKFYHLDTCLSVLNSTTAMYCEEAFTAQGLLLLKSIFSNLIKISEQGSDSPYFACNAHCPDEKNVIIQKGCTEANQKLKEQEFVIHEVDTNEFIQAGGSVFCMKLMFY